MILSRSPQCRAFSRALMDEKSLSPLFPVGAGEGGVGAVVTHDWCISPCPFDAVGWTQQLITYTYFYLYRW